MTQAFDPYHKWLGIPPGEQPPNHYRLLGLTLFEDDTDAIESAADQRMAHVRTLQLSQYAELSQRLLNELAVARVCLLKPAEKSGYDRKLRDHLVMTAREYDDALASERRAVDARMMNASPSGPLALRAGPSEAVGVMARQVATALPLAPLPVASVAPITAVQVPVHGESVATARWLANERNKTAFYRLLGRSFWALLGAIPLCLTAYVAVNQYRVRQFAAVAVRDDGREFVEPAPHALTPEIRPPVAMTDGASPSALPPTTATSQNTGAGGRVDFNPIAARQWPTAVTPHAASSGPPRLALSTDRFYPLDRVWFLGWVNSRWTDIRDRFEARQDDDSVTIRYRGENGDGIGPRQMIFQEQDPVETRMFVRFRVERGSISFGFQSRDLSTAGETVTQELTAGHACIAECWLDAAARQGVTRIVGAPQSGVVARAVPSDSYFAITLSGDSLLRLYELRFVPQTKSAFPMAVTQSAPPQGVPMPPELPPTTVDVRDSGAPDGAPQADKQPFAAEDATLKDIQASIETWSADITRLTAERGNLESEIQSMERKLPSLNTALRNTRSSKSAARAMIAIQQAKNEIKKARTRLRRLDEQIAANERHIKSARGRIEKLRSTTREAALAPMAD